MVTNVVTMPLARSQYFPALTGLRAVSAFMVFFFHVAQHLAINEMPMHVRLVVNLMLQFNVGVTIFFVLSGFLIANRYSNGVEMSTGWVRRYLQNRFARIYPLYFLLTALTFVLMVVRPTYDWYEWPATYTFLDKVVAVVLNLSLTRAYSQEMVFLGVGPAWTLTVEESFYLCAPFLLMGLKRSVRRLGLYPALLLLIGFLLVQICSRLGLPYGLMRSVDFMLTFTFFGRGLEFIAGMGLAIWLARRHTLPQSKAATWLGVVGISLCIGAMAQTVQVFPVESSEAARMLWLIYNVALPFPIIGLFYGLIHEQTWLRRLLQTPAFDLLGKSSYAFYLIHIGIINDYYAAYISANWLVRLVGLTLVAIALYKWVEHPMHQWLRARPRPAPLAVAVPPALA